MDLCIQCEGLPQDQAASGDLKLCKKCFRLNSMPQGLTPATNTQTHRNTQMLNTATRNTQIDALIEENKDLIRLKFVNETMFKELSDLRQHITKQTTYIDGLIEQLNKLEFEKELMIQELNLYKAVSQAKSKDDLIKAYTRTDNLIDNEHNDTQHNEIHNEHNEIQQNDTQQTDIHNEKKALLNDSSKKPKRIKATGYHTVKPSKTNTRATIIPFK